MKTFSVAWVHLVVAVAWVVAGWAVVVLAVEVVDTAAEVDMAVEVVAVQALEGLVAAVVDMVVVQAEWVVILGLIDLVHLVVVQGQTEVVDLETQAPGILEGSETLGVLVQKTLGVLIQAVLVGLVLGVLAKILAGINSDEDHLSVVRFVLSSAHSLVQVIFECFDDLMNHHQLTFNFISPSD